MLTAAVLLNAFRGSPPQGRRDEMVQKEKGEQFLQELAEWHDHVFHDIVPPSFPTVIDEIGDSSFSEEKPTGAAHVEMEEKDTEAMATKIQAQVRRYLHQSQYRIQQLEQRLQHIAMEKQTTIAQIQERKRRKLRKVQRKYDRREERREHEYQKVQGIIHYLQSDQGRFRKELDSLQRTTQELQKENQRLLLAKNRTAVALQGKQQEMERLCKTNDRLKATLDVYREITRQLHNLKGSPACSSSSAHQPAIPTPSARANSHCKAKAYETSIVVNSVNEVEEKCFTYRLVQDVYTLTPRTV